MIEIQVKQDKQNPLMHKPVNMLENYWQEGQVFQQYFNDKPQQDYYINCGLNEPSAIHIWFNYETRSYALSTSNKEELQGFNPNVLVAPIEARVLITLEKT
jgi:hypothetical protein